MTQQKFSVGQPLSVGKLNKMFNTGQDNRPIPSDGDGQRGAFGTANPFTDPNRVVSLRVLGVQGGGYRFEECYDPSGTGNYVVKPNGITTDSTGFLLDCEQTLNTNSMVMARINPYYNQSFETVSIIQSRFFEFKPIQMQDPAILVSGTVVRCTQDITIDRVGIMRGMYNFSAIINSQSAPFLMTRIRVVTWIQMLDPSDVPIPLIQFGVAYPAEFDVPYGGASYVISCTANAMFSYHQPNYKVRVMGSVTWQGGAVGVGCGFGLANEYFMVDQPV